MLEEKFASAIRYCVRACDLGLDVRFETRAVGRGRRSASASTRQRTLGPDESHRFATFVVGESNRLAHAASQDAAAHPGALFNPLFLYGGVGLGKTHLLQAIGHQISVDHPDFMIACASTEYFINDALAAVRRGALSEFRSRYQSVDVLLLDDVHVVKTNELAQEELFQVFNVLHDAARQVVVTADGHPQALAPLPERLRARFERGLVADIRPPDLVTRREILRQKDSDRVLSDAVIDYIAGHLASNVRQLEGALNRVIALGKETPHPVTVAGVAAVLRSLTPDSTPLVPSRIVASVSEFYGLTPSDLASRSRSHRITFARHVAMYLLRQETDLSLEKIGALLGNRDHATASHAWERISSLLARDPSAGDDVATIRDGIFSSPAK